MNNNQVGIALEHIHKSYGKKKILKDVSLQIEEGEIFGLLGPSGCGKSTTVKIIAGITKPDIGKASILGKKMPNFETMQTIGYMAQAAALYPTLSGYENLAFFGSLYKMKRAEVRKRIDELATLVHLEDSLKKPVDQYSGGMKQRLSLAITLLANPKVLILDEPTVGIDPILRKSIWEELRTLRDEGVTIIITTHVMDEVNRCDRLAMMQDGKIMITGTPYTIQKAAKADTMEDAFIYFSEQGEEELA